MNTAEYSIHTRFIHDCRRIHSATLRVSAPALLFFLLWLTVKTATAASLSMPTAPLYLSVGATPNVMLLVDNSGSMNNIIWESAFNPSTTYTSYSLSNCGNNSRDLCWGSDDGNVFVGDLRQGSCSSNYKEGRNGRCLRLPDPVGGGNTRYNGNYLNYLFSTKTANNSSADIRNSIPNDYRIQVARDVATSIVNNNPTLRFGVAAFNAPRCNGGFSNNGGCSTANYNGAPGGKILSSCGSTTATVLSSISGLLPEANTPLAETFYEITRYFRGLSSYFNSGVSYTSPIQFSCQKNFTIVITDGLPTRDTQFPNNDPADPSGKLPNWDGLSPATTAAQNPDFPRYSDGFDPSASVNSTNESAEAATLFLDDLAKFGYDIDLSSSFAGTQNLFTYTVGFAVKNSMLEDAAAYGNGGIADKYYFTAADKQTLSNALQAAVNDILARTTSATSVALNSSSLNTGTLVFQAKFNSGTWAGEISGLPVSTGKSGSNCGNNSPAGTLCPAAWNAGTKLTARTTARNIFTYKPTARTGTTFSWGNLESAQQALLNLNPNSLTAGVYATDTNGSLRLSYLAGSRTNEAETASPRFRQRASLLGDIIDSDPFYVAEPAAAYGFDNYASFRTNNANRTKVVYVGANDGMLHAFNASSDATNGGTELFSYVPSKAFGTTTNPRLALLTKLDYDTHIYTVDGAPIVGDAFVNTTSTSTSAADKQWKTILVGTLRSGGQGLYALDVTNPSSFSASNVLWEFSDRDDADLGYTFSQASIVRMANGKWAAIVGNGYNNTEADGASSTDGKSAIYIIYLDHVSGTPWVAGTDYIKLKTTAGSLASPNGMATPAAVDVDGDNKIDYIYAGDQLGNMWRFNVRSATDTDWSASGSITRLFTTNSGQPITSRPEVGYNLLQPAGPNQGLVVYFGTGSYIGVGENASTGQTTQSFYGIFDRTALRNATLAAAATADSITRTNLQSQTITGQVNSSGAACTTGADCYRLVTQNAVDPATKLGWYLDLIVSGNNNGERQVTTSILRNGRIIFTTLLPTSSPCDAGGTSWLMELDAKSGARLSLSPFDVNKDSTFSDADLITTTSGQTSTTQAAAGVQSSIGLLARPTILQATADTEFKYLAGTSNQTAGNSGITAVRERSTGRAGRITWRELIP